MAPVLEETNEIMKNFLQPTNCKPLFRDVSEKFTEIDFLNK